MSLSLKRPPPPPLRSPPKLFTIIEPYPSLLIVSVISFSLHFSLNSTLAGLYPNDEVLAEMEDRVKGEIWRFTVGAGRLICFVGMAVACVGVWGAVKDNLASLRIFALHSFITLFLSTLSITSLLFLSLLPADHAISQSFSSFLCTELTEGDLFAHSSTSAPHAPNNAPWFFDLDSDTLGWGIESCEERWRSTLGFGALLLLIVLAVLGHGVWVVWGYYRLASARKVWGSSTEVGGAVRLGGYNPVHRRTRSRSRSTSASGSGSSSGGGRHTKDRSRSTAMDLSLSNGDGKAPRILLLPPHTDVSSLSSTSATTGGAYTDEPASFSFKLTPASPEAKRDSFPPLPHAHSHSHSHSPLSSSTRQRSGSSPASTRQEYVVYAPIHITMQEAMALNAREAFVSSPSNSPSIQPAAAGLNYFASPTRTTANPLSGGSGESTPKEKGRNRSDSAATVVASSSAARNQGAGQELPRYDELQAGEKRVY